MATEYKPVDLEAVRQTSPYSRPYAAADEIEYLRALKLPEAAVEAENARLRASIKALVLSMALWGAEEDGIPDDISIGAYAAYESALAILGVQSQPGRKISELRAALAGKDAPS